MKQVYVKNRFVFWIIFVLGFLLILSVSQNIALETKYSNALQVATICEVKAYKARLDTNQPLAQKQEKDLKSLDKEFLKDFNEEAKKLKMENENE